MQPTLYLRALPLPEDKDRKELVATYFCTLDRELDKMGVNLGIMEDYRFGCERDLGRELRFTLKGLGDEGFDKTIILPQGRDEKSSTQAMFWPRDIFLTLDDTVYISPEYEDVAPLIFGQIPGCRNAEVSYLGEGGLSIFARDVILHSMCDEMESAKKHMNHHFNYCYPLPPLYQGETNGHVDMHASLLDLDAGLLLVLHNSLYDSYTDYFNKLRKRLGLSIEVVEAPIEMQPLNIVQLPNKQVMLPRDSEVMDILPTYHDMSKVLAVPDSLSICCELGGLRCATNFVGFGRE